MIEGNPLNVSVQYSISDTNFLFLAYSLRYIAEPIPIGSPIKEMSHSWIFSVNINGEGQRQVMVSDSGSVQELDIPQGAE